MKENILSMLAHFICRYGMLSPDKSSTHFKAIRLQCTLFALTVRRTFRYFLDDFTSAILKLCSAIFVIALYLLFWLLSMLLSFHEKGFSQRIRFTWFNFGIPVLYFKLFHFIICLWISTTLAPLQYIFSTAINANMKVWVYDSSGPRVDQDQDAPGLLTTMLFSADGTR